MVPPSASMVQNARIRQGDPVLNCHERKAFPAVLLTNNAIYIGDWRLGIREG